MYATYRRRGIYYSLTFNLTLFIYYYFDLYILFLSQNSLSLSRLIVYLCH